VEVFNVHDGELENERTEPDGFRWRATRIGPRIGAAKIGATVYELEPGQSTFPYHYEYGNEEWLICLAGRPTLRTPDGERELRPGDVAVFVQGPAGAHRVRNDTDEPARVLILSTKREPAIAIYPDSDKVGLFVGDLRFLVRQESAVDYWDGEL
jgi:uncharacterized cupin superfamily protein